MESDPPQHMGAVPTTKTVAIAITLAQVAIAITLAQVAIAITLTQVAIAITLARAKYPATTITFVPANQLDRGR